MRITKEQKNYVKKLTYDQQKAFLIKLYLTGKYTIQNCSTIFSFEHSHVVDILKTFDVKRCTNSSCDNPIKSWEDFGKSSSHKSGYHSHCKECQRRDHKNHYKSNSDIIRKHVKEYADNNPEKISASHKRYYQENKEKIIKYNTERREQNHDAYLRYLKDYRENNQEKFARYAEENRDRILAGYKCYYQENKEKILEYRKVYNMKNKEKISKQGKEYRRKNSVKIRRNWKKYQSGNPDKIRQYRRTNAAAFRAYGAKRRAAKLRSVPKWANLDEIQSFYKEARSRSLKSNVKYCVDHIIPLQHDLVCGLHIEYNLQVLTQSQNSQKSNNFVPGPLWFIQDNDIVSTSMET